MQGNAKYIESDVHNCHCVAVVAVPVGSGSCDRHQLS